MSSIISIRRHSLLQRAALALSAALASWAEAAADKEHSALEQSRATAALHVQRQQREHRREAAIAERLLLPRQF
ncbi:hypothetical protein [Nesterenkonia ebinurensis]|uniref:hypothetical protein n=1 Tax=Nesterenkonia ebinurensis TaxID=2608252 RepID=UPI00123D33D2|nr:hypothetical protein [Nesterenkonia ebinurensis]